jgi:hypothetical protein
MKKKLLNISKNLIIILTLVGIGIFLLSTSVLAVVSEETELSLAQVMREKIALWFTLIRTTCFAIMLILLMVFALKFLVFNRSPENLALLKSMFVDWLIGLILMFCIHYFMIGIMYINEYGISQAKQLGNSLSGLAEGEDANEEEYSLYEQALSKAYELNATSGIVGLIMYIMLVVYTYKFVIVYAKRYINVIVLILFSPIIILVSSFKKILSGRSEGILGKWFKEFIYNVLIQTVHAMFYATCVGLTVKLSENKETYIGALLTLILFGFIFKLDGFIRKIFNFVGGKSTIKRVDIWESANNIRRMDSKFKEGRAESIEQGQPYENRFKYYGGMALDSAKTKALDFKNSTINTVKDFDSVMDGKKVKVTAKEYAEEQRRRENSESILDKALYATNSGSRLVVGAGIDLGIKAADKVENISNKAKKKFEQIADDVKKDINGLEENVELVKRMPIIIGAQVNKKMPVVISQSPELLELYKAVISFEKSGKEVVDKIKDRIENGQKDMVAIVYIIIGPQAFLYPKVGSPYMGMQMLAEQNYENRIVNYYSS